jgi:NADP-dependent 3-hydroxy acid dehydrogenase YdfG
LRAVVVGGAGGIGRAVVDRFAGAGWAVETMGRTAGSVKHVVDVADGAAVASCFEAIGDVDVLVYAAGTGGSIEPFWSTAPSHIDSSVGGNVSGLLHCARAVLPGMVSRGTGHLILMGSVAALYPIPSATYSATKAAGHAFAQSLRVELFGTGVRVTEVSPGRVNTGFVRGGTGPQPAPSDLLQADDVAAAVWFAASSSPAVQVSHIELVPAAQALGASRFVIRESSTESSHENEESE